MSADPETGEIIHRADEITPPPGFRLAHEPMGLDEAKQITTKINSYAVSLCHLIVAAHDGQAWVALGSDSWESYCDEHLNVSRQRAHQLIQHARKLTILSGVAGVPADSLDVPERHTRGMDLDEAVAVVGQAIRALPEDAPVATRGDLIKAITAQMQAEALAAKPIAPASTAVDADDDEDRGEGEPASAPGDTLAAPVPASTNADAGHAAGDSGVQPEEAPASSGAAGSMPPVEPAAKDEPNPLAVALDARNKLNAAMRAMDAAAVVPLLDPEGRQSWQHTVNAVADWVDAWSDALTTPALRSVQCR